jgi:hypothetical protein
LNRTREPAPWLLANDGLPRIPRNALVAGVGARDIGELAFEGGCKREAAQPFHFYGAGDERGIIGLRRAIDDKGRAGQRLEGRDDGAIGVEIIRPDGAAVTFDAAGPGIGVELPAWNDSF